MTEDLEALRRTSEIYARGADCCCRADWEGIMTDDIVIGGPLGRTEGLPAVLTLIDGLPTKFKRTRHAIHRVDATIEGDRAHGETSCTAEHHLVREDGDKLLVWAVRYQDEWRRVEGSWRFSKRELIVDWEELRSIRPAATGEGMGM